jgi:nucleotide-binding universal stress UspA family protein
MYDKVLVPLDGSDLAECALPQVMNLANGGMIGEVTLLSVIELSSAWMEEGIDFIAIKNDLLNKADKYLQDLQSQLSSSGVKVKTATIEGHAAESIIEYSKEHDINLVVIATHGYTGMKKLMFGSVALRVLHDAHAPVLLVRPESCR